MTETVRPEPSRPFRWLVLIFISLTMFGNYYVYDCIAPIADLLVKQLGFSESNIGLLQAIYSIPNVLMVVIGGYVVDRIGTRKAIFIFGTLCFLGAGVTCLSPALSVMATGRLFFGLGAESLIVAVTTAIAKWFRGKELSFAFGINLMISRAGSPVGAAVAVVGRVCLQLLAQSAADFCGIWSALYCGRGRLLGA